MDIRRINFDLFRDLLGGLVRTLQNKGSQERCFTFKYHFSQAQYRCIPKSKKSGKGSRIFA